MDMLRSIGKQSGNPCEIYNKRKLHLFTKMLYGAIIFTSIVFTSVAW